MKLNIRTASSALAAAFGMLALAGKAEAQGPGANNPLLRPAVSPYVNLNRGGNAAANYYGIIKPQEGFAKQLQVLQQQQGNQQQLGLMADEDPTMGMFSVTGHPATFFNYAHFFGQTSYGARPTLPTAVPALNGRK